MQTRPRYKEQKTKLDPYAEQLDQWFGVEKITLKEASERMRQQGHNFSFHILGRWWRKRSYVLKRARLINQIATGSGHCQEVEKEFKNSPPPELETLIKLHRVFIMNHCADLGQNPEILKFIAQMMKPVMDWAQLREKQKGREFSEAKFKEGLRTKLEAGFEIMAEHINDNPAAKAALLNFKMTLADAAK